MGIWWWWENWIKLSFQLAHRKIIIIHYSFLRCWRKPWTAEKVQIFSKITQSTNTCFFLMMFKQYICCRKSSNYPRKRRKVYTKIHFDFFWLNWHLRDKLCVRDWVKIKFDVWLSVTQHAHLNENSRWLMMILAGLLSSSLKATKINLLSTLVMESASMWAWSHMRVDMRESGQYLRQKCCKTVSGPQFLFYNNLQFTAAATNEKHTSKT